MCGVELSRRRDEPMKKNDLAGSDFIFAPCGTLFPARLSATDPNGGANDGTHRIGDPFEDAILIQTSATPA
jgi:hypothetical protein